MVEPGASPETTAPEAAAAAWPHRHLLDTDVLTWPQIERVMDLADEMAEIVARRRPRSEALKGVGVTNLFYEASTRTRVSFEVAAKHLSADVVNVSAGGSSIEKGESLMDTMRTLEALGARVLVIRHPVVGGAVPRRARVPGQRHQRGRRAARPPDAGTPRPVHAPAPPPGRARSRVARS